MRRLIYILAAIGIITAVAACRRAPSQVIRPDDMASLLADLYVADGVVDQNHMEYRDDSVKKLLKQSIFVAHGVTQQDFDTSLVWYGHNMDRYLEVYDRTIEILKERERRLGTAIVQASVTVSGDSVDVWPMSHYARLTDRYPSRLIKFSISADDNWDPGDVYIWRTKTLDEIHSLRWHIFAHYADSTNEWLAYNTSSKGWNEVVFPTDSTKTLTDLKGYVEVVMADPYGKSDERPRGQSASRDIWLDSISLVRKRLNADMYQQRHRLRTYPDLR